MVTGLDRVYWCICRMWRAEQTLFLSRHRATWLQVGICFTTSTHWAKGKTSHKGLHMVGGVVSAKKQKLHVFRWNPQNLFLEFACKPVRNHIHPLVRKEKSVSIICSTKDTVPRSGMWYITGGQSDSVAVPRFHMKHHLFIFSCLCPIQVYHQLLFLDIYIYNSDKSFFSLLALNSSHFLSESVTHHRICLKWGAIVKHSK